MLLRYVNTIALILHVALSLILLPPLIVITDQQIGLMLSRDLQLSYRDFAQELLTSCGDNPKLADIPIQVPSGNSIVKPAWL